MDEDVQLPSALDHDRSLLDADQVLQLRTLIEQLLEIVGDRPILSVCTNALGVDDPSGHRLFYPNQGENRRCPDCGDESLVDFVIRNERDAAVEGNRIRDLSALDDVRGDADLLERFNRLMAVANVPGQPRCPHAGKERAVGCFPVPAHLRFYVGHNPGSPCPNCFHVNLA